MKIYINILTIFDVFLIFYLLFSASIYDGDEINLLPIFFLLIHLWVIRYRLNRVKTHDIDPDGNAVIIFIAINIVVYILIFCISFFLAFMWYFSQL